MRIGTAARHWDRLEPTTAQYREFRDAARRAQARVLEGGMELCYVPLTSRTGLRASLAEPPATLLVLPNGWVKVAAALPHVCADLRRDHARAGVAGVPRGVARRSNDEQQCGARSTTSPATREANTWQLNAAGRV